MISKPGPELSFESALGVFFPKAAGVLGAVCGQARICSGTSADQDCPVVFEWQNSKDSDPAGDAVHGLDTRSLQASRIKMHSASVHVSDVQEKDPARPKLRLVHIPVSCIDRPAGRLLFLVSSETASRDLEDKAEMIRFMLSLWLRGLGKRKKIPGPGRFYPQPPDDAG